MISGVRKAALVDDTAGSPTEGTVVQLNHVEEDGEFYCNGLGEEMASGIELHAGNESHAELGFAGDTGLDQLQDWQDDDTLLKLIVAGIQANGLWYQPVAIRVVDLKNFTAGERAFNRVMLDSDLPNPAIHKGINLLYLVDQAHAADTYDILFPIDGVELTLSADGGSSGTLDLIALDKDDVQLAIQSTALGSRASVSLKLPPSTYTVRVNLPVGSTEPALRVDGSTKYIAG